VRGESVGERYELAMRRWRSPLCVEHSANSGSWWSSMHRRRIEHRVRLRRACASSPLQFAAIITVVYLDRNVGEDHAAWENSNDRSELLNDGTTAGCFRIKRYVIAVLLMLDLVHQVMSSTVLRVPRPLAHPRCLIIAIFSKSTGKPQILRLEYVD